MKNQITRVLTNGMLIAVSSLLVCCSSGSDRYEDIVKLRGIGISSLPVVAPPSTASAISEVIMTFYAALPLGGTISSVTPFIDTEAALTVPLVPVTVVPNSLKPTDHFGFRLYQVQATATIPPANDLLFDAASGFATVHFGLTLASDHGSQDMVGNLVIYPTGSAELAQLNNTPKIAISAPTKGATVGPSRQTINANLTPVNSETFRIGWFVSGGSVDNRNDSNTVWNPDLTGNFTVIATARGVQTAAFAFDITDVIVQ